MFNIATARPKGKGYEIRVSSGYDIHGKRIRVSRTWIPEPGMTPKQIQKELERQKVLCEEQIKYGLCPDNRIRFVDFSKKWMEDYGKNNLSIKAYGRYNQYLTRINDGIGHLKLKDITPVLLNAFYKALEADGESKHKRYDADGNVLNNGRLAPKTILEHHRVISKILATAVKWDYLEKNPAERADPPKVPYQERRYLDEEETREMLFLLESEPIQYRTMITLLVYTGIRRGELCGLEWRDIDFDSNVIHISRSSQYIGDKQIITKEPKTRSGFRHFIMSDSICELLKEYQNWQNQQKIKAGKNWEETDRLFTQWNGLPIYPDTVTDWFAKFIRRSGLPYVTLHSLRHTNATLMIAEGIDICAVSKRLGHASTATTLNVYAHALKSKDKAAAEALENVLDFHAKSAEIMKNQVLGGKAGGNLSATGTLGKKEESREPLIHGLPSGCGGSQHRIPQTKPPDIVWERAIHSALRVFCRIAATARDYPCAVAVSTFIADLIHINTKACQEKVCQLLCVYCRILIFSTHSSAGIYRNLCGDRNCTSPKISKHF